MKEFIKAIIGLLAILLYFIIVDIVIKPYNPSPKEGLDTFENYDGHL